MKIEQLQEITDLFLDLEMKKFPNYSTNSATAMAKQIGTMSVFISDRDAKRIIKMIKEEIEVLDK